MKRTKLIASLLTSVMCLSFLVIGVWAAAVNVNFNLNSVLKYYPEGVYVELSGQVYRGSSEETLEALTYDPRFTLSPTTNYDNSTGEPSGNFPMENWEIGAIPFVPTEKLVKIVVAITNNSEFTIGAFPDITIDNESILEIESIEVSDNSINLFSIGANDKINYELVLKVNSTVELNSNLSVSFDFANTTANYNYFTIENNQITGLTQKYIDDSPEVLVIPGYTEDGLNQLLLSSYAFRTVNIQSSVIIFQEGLKSIATGADITLNNTKSIFVPSSLLSFGSHYKFTILEKAYFYVLEGWSYGNGQTISSENLSNPYLAVKIFDETNFYGYGIKRT